MYAQGSLEHVRIVKPLISQQVNDKDEVIESFYVNGHVNWKQTFHFCNVYNWIIQKFVTSKLTLYKLTDFSNITFFYFSDSSQETSWRRQPVSPPRYNLWKTSKGHQGLVLVISVVKLSWVEGNRLEIFLFLNYMYLFSSLLQVSNCKINSRGYFIF